MKVYNKNDDIKCYGKNIFMMMDNFFKNYPSEYSKLYYKNLESLSFIRCNRLNNGINTGMYDADNNIIYFTDNNSLGHEMFHVASNDIDRKNMGIDLADSDNSALLEGMTEQLFIDTYNISGEYAYQFEVMVSRVLSQIPDFFKYYFIPDHDKFISLFNNKDTINSLIDNLNLYGKISDYVLSIFYLDKNINGVDDRAKLELICAIESVISDLIYIGYENKDTVDLNNYINNLRNLLNGSNINKLFKLFYPDYLNYTNNVVKRLEK